MPSLRVHFGDRKRIKTCEIVKRASVIGGGLGASTSKQREF